MSAFKNSCEEFFGSDNLYEVLKVEKDAAAETIKKAYYKLSLRVHPDRVPEDEKAGATAKFQVLGKVYSVLSNKEKRLLYDQTGVIDDEEALNQEKDWYTFWRLLFKLSVEDIKSFEKRYKGSDEELKDLKEAYLKSEGDMDQIMDEVMCSTIEDEDRFTELLKVAIDSGELPEFEEFVQECKKKRTARKRKAKKEELEAEEMQKELFKDVALSPDAEDALTAIIQGRQGQRMDSLMASLEAKYCQPKKSKKGSAKSTKSKRK